MGEGQVMLTGELGTGEFSGMGDEGRVRRGAVRGRGKVGRGGGWRGETGLWFCLR